MHSSYVFDPDSLELFCNQLRSNKEKQFFFSMMWCVIHHFNSGVVAEISELQVWLNTTKLLGESTL